MSAAVFGHPCPRQEHQRFLLGMQLGRLDEIEVHLTKLDARIEDKLQPYAEDRALICEVPGMDRINSARVVAELGTDMSLFASEAHVASWAGFCPGNNESSARRHRSCVRKGNVYLTITLVEAARRK